jgi:hypothetical protein
MIAGGLYSVTALLKTGGEETVYPKHQELKQASATSKTLVASQLGSNRRCPGRGRRPRRHPLPLPRYLEDLVMHTFLQIVQRNACSIPRN